MTDERARAAGSPAGDGGPPAADERVSPLDMLDAALAELAAAAEWEREARAALDRHRPVGRFLLGVAEADRLVREGLLPADEATAFLGSDALAAGPSIAAFLDWLRESSSALSRGERSTSVAHDARAPLGVALRVGWVERDEGMKALVHGIGSRSGCRVEVFPTNHALLAADDLAPFGVAVLRVHDATDANGAADQLRERAPRVAVALSRNCDHDRHRADPTGFDMVIPFPIDTDLVLAWLRRIAPAGGRAAGENAAHARD